MDAKPAPDRSLKDTIRALRIDEAERTGVVVALREADLARLGMPEDRLRPVLAEVPAHVDLFDTGITPGETPRLWIDMISFVEIGRDRRSYRFLQDTRDGRRVLIESADLATVSARITAYVAQRLIERERLLAQTPSRSDGPAAEPALPPADLPAAFIAATAPREEPAPVAESTPAAPPPAPAPAVERVRFSGFGAFVIFLIGIAAGIGGVLLVAQIAVKI